MRLRLYGMLGEQKGERESKEEGRRQRESNGGGGMGQGKRGGGKAVRWWAHRFTYTHTLSLSL